MSDRPPSPIDRIRGGQIPKAPLGEDEEELLLERLVKDSVDYQACVRAPFRRMQLSLEVFGAQMKTAGRPDPAKGNIYECPTYRLYVNLTAGLVHSRYFIICFSTTVYHIHGENLQDVAHAVGTNRAMLIRAFNPDFHKKPEADRPLISAIVIERGGKVDEIYKEAHGAIAGRTN